MPPLPHWLVSTWCEARRSQASIYESFPSILHGTTRIAAIKRNRRTHRPVQLCVNKKSALVEAWSTADLWFLFLVFFKWDGLPNMKSQSIFRILTWKGIFAICSSLDKSISSPSNFITCLPPALTPLSFAPTCPPAKIKGQWQIYTHSAAQPHSLLKVRGSDLQVCLHARDCMCGSTSSCITHRGQVGKCLQLTIIFKNCSGDNLFSISFHS